MQNTKNLSENISNVKQVLALNCGIRYSHTQLNYLELWGYKLSKKSQIAMIDLNQLMKKF